MTARRRDSDFEYLLEQLEGEFELLVRQLAPGGTMTGDVYQPLNPLRNDTRPGSFVIYVKGPKKGFWCENSPNGLPGQGGAYDFVAYILGGGNIAAGRKLAYPYLRDRYGVEKADEATRAKWRERRKVRLEKQAKEADTQGRNRRRAAKRIFFYETAERVRDTPTHRYLEARGIDFATLGRFPGSIRHAGELAHPEDGVYGPAMVAAATQWAPDGGSRFLSCHRTFLGQDAAGVWRKRGDVEPDIRRSKFALGDYKGAAVNVWRGASGKRLADAPKGDRVVITEGLEDALSIAFAYAGRDDAPRVLCAIAISNIANVVLPPAITDVRIAVDNDGDNPEAAAAIERAVEAFGGQGRDVSLARARAGAKDFNDLLTDKGEHDAPF